jgi:hypothetical protein
VIEKHGAKAVLDRALAIRLPAFAAVPEKAVQEIVSEHKLGFMSRFDKAISDSLCEQRRIAVAARA